MVDGGRNALITGGSRGLGRALAGALVERGWTVVITGRDRSKLAEAERELGAHGVTVAGDIADPAHRTKLVDAARRINGLDVVVNNASTLGVSPLPPLLEYPLDRLELVYRVNTIAPLALLQALRPELRPGARIVNVTSDAGVEAYVGWGGYGSSKAALEQLSAILAAENPDLRVYRVDPGDMRTDMHQEAFPGEDIGDRPPPEASVPGFLRLIEGEFPSGRYAAREVGSR